MEAWLEISIDGLNLDRSDWPLVKFGDVAIQQKQSVDRENTDLTRYVKGEHMYTEDLHLREWGELTDEYLGPAFIRKFEEGDILYGSRRTYLRKVVMAPFEGITSNTTFVIKANEKIIDKRILTYVMLSEGFAQHSIKNSKGSVNPYVNWKDLSGYEFLLPSLDEQNEIIDLLMHLDELSELNIVFGFHLKALKTSLMKYLRDGGEKTKKVQIRELMNLCYGKGLVAKDRRDGAYPVVTSAGIQGSHDQALCKGPGVVIGRKGNVGQVTYIETDFWTIDTAYYIELKEEYQHIPMKFFSFLLEAVNLKKFSIATAVPGLNRDDAILSKVSMFIDDADIERFLYDMNKVDKALAEQEQFRSGIAEIRKSIINQVF
jgi:type I restriction enzyme S subunit